MVVALVALVTSAGGTVTAAALITSADIKDNTIRSADIRNRAVQGIDVKNNSLTGSDVKESTLSPVPSAANATNAANAGKLDGWDSTQFVRKAESFTRQFSCAGTAWESAFSTAAYTTNGSLKQGNGATTLFRCSVDAPSGATVTAVSFAVRDTGAQGNSCSMWRTNMTTSVGVETLMADAATSGTPGNVRISDTTVNQPLIDNDNFTYFVQCFVGPDSTTGVFGAIVTYTVNGELGIGSQTVESPAESSGTSTDGLGE
jgi:hypothetical protein